MSRWAKDLLDCGGGGCQIDPKSCIICTSSGLPSPKRQQKSADIVMPPLINQLRRTIFTVIGLELGGLVATIFVGSTLSHTLGTTQSDPLGIVLAIDYTFIILSAVLAELAAPTENAGILTTSFIVATSTLAPLAVHASKAIFEGPKEHNILLDFTTLDTFRVIISIGVALCTIVAFFAAFTLRSTAVRTSKGSTAGSNPPGPILRVGLLIVSISLFGSYTFLANDWGPTKIPASVTDFALPAIGFVLLMAIFCAIAAIVGRGVKRFLFAYQIEPGLQLLSRLFRAIGPGLAAVVAIVVLAAVLLRKFVNSATTDDLAYSLFLFAATFAFFAALGVLIVAIRLLRAGVLAILNLSGLFRATGLGLVAVVTVVVLAGVLLQKFAKSTATDDLNYFLFLFAATFAFFVTLGVLIAIRLLSAGVLAFLNWLRPTPQTTTGATTTSGTTSPITGVYATAMGNDYAAHEQTYLFFVKMLTVGIAVVVIILILMAYFLT
jgi:hypothetical protein